MRKQILKTVLIGALVCLCASIYPGIKAYQRRERWRKAWEQVPGGWFDQMQSELEHWCKGGQERISLDSRLVLADIQLFLDEGGKL